MIDDLEDIERYRLPDGRLPVAFDTGKAAFYEKIRGSGEVRYPFSEVRYRRSHRQTLTSEERSAVARERAKNLLAKNPNFYREIGTAGGKNSKRKKPNDSQHKRDPQS